MPRKQIFLMHKHFARCRILAARYTSTGGKEMFFCETVETTDAGTKTTQRQLLTQPQYWNEDEEQITFVFEDYLANSEKIERALALKAKKQAEVEAANVTNQTDDIPDSEPDVKPLEIRRRERELDLSDFDPEGFNVVEEDSDDARDSLGLVMP